MLKTNTKKAINNIKDYVIDYMSDEEEYFTSDEIGKLRNNNDTTREENFKLCADMLISELYVERGTEIENGYWKSIYDAFKEWMNGLPFALSCYYYNRSAIKDLGNILEETDEEREKYTEKEAAERLTQLIYREISKVAQSKVSLIASRIKWR